MAYEVDTAILAFESADRADFIGALDVYYAHGAAAKVHRDHANSVLTAEDAVETFVDVEIEPWDVQNYVLKWAFDVMFAVVGLLGFLPLSMLVVMVIKLDDGESVLYRQERTAAFGDTFDVFKSRTMKPTGKNLTPVEDEKNYRITRIGTFQRRTHLDEMQLWTILVGDRSVVRSRAVWTAEESILEDESDMWRKRWFVKPRLTGLAHTHDAKRHESKGVAESGP